MAPSTKKTWRDSLPIDMLLSAVSVLVVAQSSSEIPEGLMNNTVYCSKHLEDDNKGTGKSVPLQAWSGPEGSRKLSFPDFMTTAQEFGKVVSFTHRPLLPPGKWPRRFQELKVPRFHDNGTGRW